MIKQYGRKAKTSMFYENEESRLYRKFLNNWSTYGQKKQEKIGRYQNLFGKANKYLVDIVDDGLMTAVRKMKKINS